MKPALHRSLTFWFGLLAILFTLFAWQDSGRTMRGVKVSRCHLSHATGGIAIGYSGRDPAAYRLARHEIEHPSIGRYRGKSGIVYRVQYNGRRALPIVEPWLDWGGNLFEFFLPYWLILGIVLVFWVGALAWRSRRRKIRYITITIEPTKAR